MHTIRRRLNILFALCSITAVLLTMLFVNITINNKFNEYMLNIQNKREERIVTYFQEIYKREGKWNKDSGVELIHEAYMGNYCLTLLDAHKEFVWGMNPGDIRYKTHLNNMLETEGGVYRSKTFEIAVDGNIVGYVDIGQYSPILLSEEDMNFKLSINKSIIISGIVTLIIIISISFYFSGQFSAPIREVSSMSVNLSNGNFNIKSNVKSDIKELEDLRRSTNILAEKLKYQDMLRKRLVSDISHEIRTPLNVLQNNLEAMIDGILPISKERLNHLNEEVVRFGKLLNNLELLKQFESESIQFNFEILSLDELIMSIYNDFRMEAENKNITFECVIQPNQDYKVAGDRDQLKQVFINLIANALKFTGPDGNVVIDLHREHHYIILEIEDTGIGIKKEDLPFVFERFYRGDKSRHQTLGSGIGLTIVKNILEFHSASIDVESQEGLGTKFQLKFIGAKNNDKIIKEIYKEFS
ncbi:HAMP domain-containing sensor histidine kinase [Defluviitalea saccharophila]|uniref:histidine kinase n=1 Tax=Defluviitalea saccharophila TaxID=879970 RepID=A0ABZ2Y8P5_9FIRM